MRDREDKDFFAAALRVWNLTNRVLEFYRSAREEKVLEFEKLSLNLAEICRREHRGIEEIEHLQRFGETSEQLRRFKDRTAVQVLRSGKESALLFEEWLASVFPKRTDGESRNRNGTDLESVSSIRTDSKMQELFTIGHSTHEPGEFVRLLRLDGITAVGDVRSNPFSRNTRKGKINPDGTLIKKGRLVD